MSEEFHFPQLHITKITPGEEEDYEEAVTPYVCDFCFDKRVRWEYPCERFWLAHLDWGSDGPFMACEQCAELIEQGYLPNLSARVMRSWTAMGVQLEMDLADAVGQMLQAFFDHRAGQREAFG
jgi:hypothetical protein